MIDPQIRDLVRQRANHRCEYCQIPQKQSRLTHHVEHIIAKQHGGSDDAANLALACHRCNLRKGPNLSGVDPASNEVEPLFHPRRDQWDEHFRVTGVRIEGITPSGRATVSVLAMNDARRLDLRLECLMLGDLT